ncbi:MAG: hypothetical protein ACRDDZ_04145 [Marinifilaceae bacterium]
MTQGYISILHKKREESYFIVLKTPFKFVLPKDGEYPTEHQKMLALTYDIVYQVPVNDMDEAEKYLFSMLKAGGMHNDNLIVWGKVKEAENIVNDLPSLFPANFYATVGDIQKPAETHSDAEKYYKLGMNSYYGLENTPINRRRALRMFKKSVRKGYTQAHLLIAQIYFYDFHKHKRIRKAFKHLSIALHEGVYDAFALLAFIYNHNREFDKADECWESYFTLDNYQFREEIPFNCFMYLQYCFYEHREIKYLRFIRRYKESVILNLDNMTSYLRNNTSEKEYQLFNTFCERVKVLLN